LPKLLVRFLPGSIPARKLCSEESLTSARDSRKK
jgi:hypothetical protein